jgi:hypothetical protein
MCFDAEHFISYTENFKIFVENTVTKSAKMHQIAYSFKKNSGGSIVTPSQREVYQLTLINRSYNHIMSSMSPYG